MTNETERPNTVSGLVAKHKQLCILRERYRAEIKKLTIDIDHIDACIQLFDVNADANRIKEYVTQHRAQKGSVKRFILSTLGATAAALISMAN
jgi:hypothetical protein